MASIETTALRPLRSTRTSEPRDSDLRRACRTTCAQNWPNCGQVSHSAAHRALASEVNATLIPSPYRHQARSGSPDSVARMTSDVGLGRVMT